MRAFKAVGAAYNFIGWYLLTSLAWNTLEASFLAILCTSPALPYAYKKNIQKLLLPTRCCEAPCRRITGPPTQKKINLIVIVETMTQGSIHQPACYMPIITLNFYCWSWLWRYRWDACSARGECKSVNCDPCSRVATMDDRSVLILRQYSKRLFECVHKLGCLSDIIQYIYEQIVANSFSFSIFAKMSIKILFVAFLTEL